MNYNSSKNQDIKRKFVDREVFACVTSMVEYILGKSYEDNDTPFSYEDVENYYAPVCPECHGTDITESVIEEGEDDETIYKCEYCDKVLTEGELDSEPQEVYEWWIVSGWLADKLRAKGEVIIDDYTSIWGRTCTGQAILLDGVISEICAEMGILEGQAHDWSKF